MKKGIYILLSLFLLSCGNGKTASISPDASKEISASKVTVQSVLSNIEKGRYREGELLVKFRKGIMKSAAAQTHKAAGAIRIKTVQGVGIDLVKLPQGLDVKDAIIRYMDDPSVEYAEPNYILRLSTVPNDTYFDPQQWALRNTGNFASGTLGADIKGPGAWDISRGTDGVVVAVLDSGVDYTHQDLVGNMWINTAEDPNNGIDDDGNGFVDDWRGWNFVFSDRNGDGICNRAPEDPTTDENCHDPMDDLGHGTHVAGIIGAVGNNGTGISGLMWDAQLMPLKVCNSNGECLVDAILDGISYAVSKGAKVINGSFGGPVFISSIADALEIANSAGVLFVASAGNGGDDGIGDNNDLAPDYPSGYTLPNIISVAATDQNDKRATFSNFGLNSVHVAAPGVYILSTVPPGLSFSLCTGSSLAGLDFCSGTSMSAPYVTGLAGLLYSHYNRDTQHFTYSQIRGIILKYVDVLPTLSGWIMTGGRINAERALSSLLTPSNLVATGASPTSITLSWNDNATGEEKYVIERRQSDGTFIPVGETGPNGSTFTDSGLGPNTTHTYRVRAMSFLPNPPDSALIPAESFNSTEASATTPAETAQTSTGGGGGCSVASARKSDSAPLVDVALLLLPLLSAVILRRKR